VLVRYTPSSLTSSTWLMRGNGAGVRKCLLFGLRNIIILNCLNVMSSGEPKNICFKQNLLNFSSLDTQVSSSRYDF